MHCLADTSDSGKEFIFIAEQSVALKNPGLFSRWKKENERNYLNQLMLFLPSDSTSTLLLKPLRENSFQDSVVLVKDYKLVLGLKCEKRECPRTVRGQAEFRLNKTNEDLWFIYQWIDYAVGDEPTWSELRAYFGK